LDRGGAQVLPGTNPKSLPIANFELPINRQEEERFTCLSIGNSKLAMGNDESQ
jgi:hypothetical protein